MLLGDSADSQLPSNILDTIVEVCLFARDVTVAHEDTAELWRQLEAAELSFSEIGEQLQRFRRVGESGLLASVKDASRAEMKEHGREAADAVGRMIDRWLGQYQSARDTQVADFRRQIDALHEQMLGSLDRFALPLRAQASECSVQRALRDGGGYRDTATLQLLPGLRAQLELEDTETEQPRRLRTLLGKGSTLQVGTKKALLRRTEEPAHVSLDDLVVVAAQIGASSVRLELAKKPGGPVTLRVGLGLSGDEVVGRGELPDGGGNQLPESDREVMRRLWDAMQAEATRIVASPARSLEYTLRDEAVESPAGFVNVAEQIVKHYRPTIRTIMEHSPNPEELTVKVEFGERREEKWIRRETLAEHLQAVPAVFASRIAVPEVYKPAAKALPKTGPKAGAKPPPPPPADIDPVELKATRAYTAVPVQEMPREDTQDISLTDLEVQGDGGPPAKQSGTIDTDDDATSEATRTVKKPPPPGALRRPKR